MYTISKGPSKIVTNTRRGTAQNFERLENSTGRKSVENDANNVPKPIFHGTSKRTVVQNQHEVDSISPQHEELIKYVRESWGAVCHQYNKRFAKDPVNNNNVQQKVFYYDDGEGNARLKDFKPFDLESWWGKRIFNSITKSV